MSVQVALDNISMHIDYCAEHLAVLEARLVQDEARRDATVAEIAAAKALLDGMRWVRATVDVTGELPK